MSSVLLLAVVAFLLALVCPALSAFGDAFDYGRDEKFRYMGEAKIAEFNITDGEVLLDIVFEDTRYQDEMWLFDFQPYEFVGVKPVTTGGLGGVVAANTGTCSNIFNDMSFDENNGFYKDSFSMSPPGSKILFQTYSQGLSYSQKGDIEVREDHVTYTGEIDVLFQCANSQGDNVWVQNVYDDSIEFNTTLFMTNIRPRFSDDGTLDPPYVQSYIVLYWRLLRIAVSRFLISSVARLRPIFEYAVVGPVFINSDREQGLDRSRAAVEILFWTVTDLQTSASLISVYKSASLIYKPLNNLNGLAFIQDVPDVGCSGALGMESDVILDSQISTSTVLDDSPVYSGAHGRLNAVPEVGASAGAWFADIDDPTPYIEVTFIALTTVTGVSTQGRTSTSGNFWVAAYNVLYEVYSDSSDAYVVDENDVTITFSGNFDQDTVVTNYLRSPLRTKRLRLEVTETNIGAVALGGQVAMRMEILGCRDDLPVRLANGGSPDQGRVEVYYQGQWGTVCEDNWSTNAATVVCRQLGYRYAQRHLLDGTRSFGPGTGSIWLDETICDGREASLHDCTYPGYGTTDCVHADDVGVLCSQAPVVTVPSVRLVDGTYHYEGRVEIWHNNQWGTVCNGGWTRAAATVVCRELGFADSVEAVVDGRYGPGSSEDLTLWLQNVICHGDESDLDQCQHDNWGTVACSHADDAGVVCIGESPHQSVEDKAVLNAPACNYTYWPGGCTQHWLFKVVLDIDLTGAQDRLPIDATGEFEFRYLLYECPDLNAESTDRDDCQRLNIQDAIISHEITLQTTVEVTDEDRDSPLLEVVNVYGRDPARDLRFSLFQPGVSHLEIITVETRFFPEFLRLTLELELTLFMICIGDRYESMRDGCLAAPSGDRFSAYTSPEFFYTKLVDQDAPEGATEFLNADSLSGDNSQQELQSYEYIADEEIHRTTFINKALSAESRVYTITNVFQLVELGTGRKRVVRRDIVENSQAPVGVKHAFLFAGCPANSTHDGGRDCICNAGLKYSTQYYECIPVDADENELSDFAEDDVPSDEIDNVIDTNLKNVDRDNGSATTSEIFALSGSLICIFLIRLLDV